jgi:hypothetical protein
MLVLSGYGLGLFLAAQVGPVTLLIIRSVLRGGRAVAVGLAMAVAVAGIDLAYAIVGLSGVGRVLNGGSPNAASLHRLGRAPLKLSGTPPNPNALGGLPVGPLGAKRILG